MSTALNLIPTQCVGLLNELYMNTLGKNKSKIKDWILDLKKIEIECLKMTGFQKLSWKPFGTEQFGKIGALISLTNEFIYSEKATNFAKFCGLLSIYEL